MKSATSLLLGFMLVGCTVSASNPRTTVPLPSVIAPATIAPGSGPSQQLVIGQSPSSQWWTAFGSDKLDALVVEAMAHNNDLATAEATLRQTREQARATAGGQGPQVDANYQVIRARVSNALTSPLADDSVYLYTLHTAQVTVAYPLDLFGAGRNKVRSARAAADVAADRLQAARTTVIANLVVAVIQYTALDAELAATRAAISNDEQLVGLLQRRRALGDIGEADVAAQQTVLATTQAALPPLERQQAHEAGLIASLTGKPAGTPLPPLPAFDELRLPSDLPVELPAGIVANRPDVRAAEAQMRGAAADVGSAIAARLPAIELTGNAGGAATRFADMFATGNPFYALLGSVSQPLFHSGQLLHQQHAAEAALDAAKAQYRAAALQAFLDVDDALVGLRTDAVALDASDRASSAASRTLFLTRRQVELGASGTLALLNASATASQASVQLIQSRAARFIDTVALFQACGADSRIPRESP